MPSSVSTSDAACDTSAKEGSQRGDTAASAQDFAAKLLVSTGYGDFLADEPLIAEAKALVGSAWDARREAA